MSPQRFIWVPRVAAMAFILFLSLFALDAFSGEASASTKLVGFLIHMIPSTILALLLAVSWRRPGVGAGAFIVMAALFTVFFETYDAVLSFLVISLPLVIVACLFALAYVIGRRRKTVYRIK